MGQTIYFHPISRTGRPLEPTGVHMLTHRKASRDGELVEVGSYLLLAGDCTPYAYAPGEPHVGVVAGTSKVNEDIERKTRT